MQEVSAQMSHSHCQLALIQIKLIVSHCLSAMLLLSRCARWCQNGETGSRASGKSERGRRHFQHHSSIDCCTTTPKHHLPQRSRMPKKQQFQLRAMSTLSLGRKLRRTPSLVMTTVRMQPPEEPSRASARPTAFTTNAWQSSSLMPGRQFLSQNP